MSEASAYMIIDARQLDDAAAVVERVLRPAWLAVIRTLRKDPNFATLDLVAVHIKACTRQRADLEVPFG
jgi:hypothetical protein